MLATYFFCKKKKHMTPPRMVYIRYSRRRHIFFSRLRFFFLKNGGVGVQV